MMTRRHPAWSHARIAHVAAAAGLAIALLLTAPAVNAAPARALRAFHAYYVRSIPAAHAVVKTAPAVVTITFAEPVTPGGSGVMIYDAKNRVVSGAAEVEQNDLATLSVPMTGDNSEVYLVVWHTVSAVDGDADVDAFSFFVNSSGSSSLAPKASASPPTKPPDAPIWLAGLAGLAGVLIGLGGGAVWTRRTPAPVGAAENQRL